MTTVIDSDKYYTPPSIASKAFEYAQLASRPIVCADTACGSGSLLTAAENVLQAKYCLGIDNDHTMIRKLRRERPNWRLYVGDFLKRNLTPSIAFPESSYEVDLLVLNPPFSMGAKKYISIKYLGQTIKCSVAMAHILRSFELFKPSHGAIAVVPESLLYSNVDENARELLQEQFSLSELLQLNIHTFKGASVNSSFVQFKTDVHKNYEVQDSPIARNPIFTNIVRGGLQMHAFERIQSGVKVIHSTSLKFIAANGIAGINEKTFVKAKGRIFGWMLLLPRVGVPKEELFRAFHSKSEVQLSDCVIGLKFSAKDAAIIAEKRIRLNWNSLVNLYRGTGARYITIDRLRNWLHTIGIYNQDL